MAAVIAGFRVLCPCVTAAAFVLLELKPFTQTEASYFPGSLFPGRWLEVCVRLKHTFAHFSCPQRKRDLFGAHLDRAVLDAGRLASHVTGVAAACAAFHLHAGRPDEEVGGGGIHLAPGDLVDGRPHLTPGRQSLFHHCRARDGGENRGCERARSCGGLPCESHPCSACACCVPALSSGQGSGERRPCSAAV